MIVKSIEALSAEEIVDLLARPTRAYPRLPVVFLELLLSYERRGKRAHYSDRYAAQELAYFVASMCPSYRTNLRGYYYGMWRTKRGLTTRIRLLLPELRTIAGLLSL